MSEDRKAGTVHVCTGCTHPDREKRGPVRAGETLLPMIVDLVREAGLAERLDVAGYSCIGQCGSRLRLSVGGPRRWSWLIGDLTTEALPEALRIFLARWVDAPDGFLPKDARPPALRRHLIGRVPPL